MAPSSGDGNYKSQRPGYPSLDTSPPHPTNGTSHSSPAAEIAAAALKDYARGRPVSKRSSTNSSESYKSVQNGSPPGQSSPIQAPVLQQRAHQGMNCTLASRTKILTKQLPPIEATLRPPSNGRQLRRRRAQFLYKIHLVPPMMRAQG